MQRFDKGSSTLWVAADIGLAKATIEITNGGGDPDVEVKLTPWADVAGVRLAAKLTEVEHAKVPTLRLKAKTPALDESATEVTDRDSYTELRAFAGVVIARTTASPAVALLPPAAAVH